MTNHKNGRGSSTVLFTNNPLGITVGNKKGPRTVPTLDSVVGYIQTVLSSSDTQQIRSRVIVADRVRAISDNENYGPDRMNYLYNRLGRKRDAVRAMVTVVNRFEPTDIDRLIALRHVPTGNGLSWSHLICLSRLNDRDKAFGLAVRAVDGDMNVKELCRIVTVENGVKTSNGGRKPKRPSTFDACLSDIVARCTALSNAVAYAWTQLDALAADSGIGKRSVRTKYVPRIDEATESARQAAADLSGVVTVLQSISGDRRWTK